MYMNALNDCYCQQKGLSNFLDPDSWGISNDYYDAIRSILSQINYDINFGEQYSWYESIPLFYSDDQEKRKTSFDIIKDILDTYIAGQKSLLNKIPGLSSFPVFSADKYNSKDPAQIKMVENISKTSSRSKVNTIDALAFLEKLTNDGKIKTRRFLDPNSFEEKESGEEINFYQELGLPSYTGWVLGAGIVGILGLYGWSQFNKTADIVS